MEACRDGAIRFSREYNLAGTRKEDFIMDLFQRLEAQRVEAENGGWDTRPSSADCAAGTGCCNHCGSLLTKPLETSLEAK